MFFISEESLKFPPVYMANSQGLLGFGGDLSVERLKKAYNNGIFPWYAKEEEILWWAPDPRMVLFPSEVKISKSMRSLIRKNIYEITENQEFEQVINYCAISDQRNKKDSWLHPEMIEAYIALHKEGLAHSIEVWNQAGKLVGGLYTVQVNPNVISGESMFHLESNTSKLAFIHLAKKAEEKKIKAIDCQIYTPHLASLGAREIPRNLFMEILNS
jgi:leucyl/phenylalanyl-tRNA--protein transferase